MNMPSLTLECTVHIIPIIFPLRPCSNYMSVLATHTISPHCLNMCDYYTTHTITTLHK